jgi:hypothetical protein
VLTPFERTALIVLLILAVDASRGVTWFTLFTLVVLPAALRDWPLPDLPLERGRVILAVVLPLVVLVTIVDASRPASWLARDYPSASARIVARAAGTQRAVFANGAFSDWLMFAEPTLRGRMAYDARFSVLPHGRLSDAADVSIGRSDTQALLRPFDVVVMRPQERELGATLASAGWDLVDAGPKVVVFRRAR